MNRGLGRIIARTLTLTAVAQASFGCYLLAGAILNVREARRIMRESKP